MENQDYLELFVEESQEYIQTLNTSLLALEEHADDLEIIHTIFRAAHTLKGMAAAMHFVNMAHLTHEMESSLDLVRSGELCVDDSVLGVLFECVDVLQRQLDEIVASGSDARVVVTDTVSRIQRLSRGETDSHVRHSAAVIAGADVLGAIRDQISAGLSVYEVNVTIDVSSPMPSVRGYMVKRAYEAIGEVLWSNPADPAKQAFDGTLTLLVSTSLELSAVQQVGFDVLEVSDVFAKLFQLPDPEVAAASSATLERRATQPRKPQFRTIRVGVDRLDALMKLYSELLIDQTRLKQLARVIDHPELHETVHHLSRVGGDLQDLITKIRMVPLETVFNRFPRMIRDLSKALNKRVRFEVQGEDTEIDRLLADEIADPLLHLLRNSMDHGLETPAERARAGKSDMGTIRLSAYYSENHVFLEIEDDGRGIQREKVLQKALSQGLIGGEEGESLSDEQVCQLLFRSGFSTAEEVSDISGRGVGLDAVREKILALSGDVSVRSTPGEGSTFIIRLPS